MARNGKASSLIEGALEWASNGVPVFPCSSNKRPLTANGFKDAVTDPNKVRELFEFYGDQAQMVGARMGADAGMFAIDFDLYKELDAKAFMDNLASQGLLPETRIHKTTSGGVHLLYFSNGVFPNVNPVDGVEVKGEGGYVIVPPSPGYTTLREGMIEAPEALVNALLTARAKQGEDTVGGLKEKIRSAANFHDSLTRLAAKLSGGGWSAEQVMVELVNTLQGSVAASPEHPRHSRWKKLLENTENEVSRIVGTGHTKYNSFAPSEDLGNVDALGKLRDIGARLGFKPPLQRGHEDANDKPEVKSIEAFAGQWPFEDEGYFAHIDHDLLAQRFVMHPVLCEDESILIAAEPKTGKTAIALTVGLHIACGYDLGPSLRVAEPRGVLYFGLEGRRAIRLRIAAWRRNQSELGKVLPTHIPLFVVERSKNLLHENERQSLANAIAAASIWMEKEHGISLGAIFIDTYTKAMPGGDQNSVEDTSSVFDLVGRVRECGVSAAVAFIHHKARAGNIRGSTNIEADPDVLTSIYKEGDRIVWRLDRARSVEEGASYPFRIKSYDLGDSQQGFAIKAPIIEALDEEVEEPADITAAKHVNTALSLIIGLGNGRHDLKTVYQVLQEAGLAPDARTVRGVRTRTRVDQKKVQDYINGLIPDTGYVFGGKAVEKVIENGLVAAILVR